MKTIVFTALSGFAAGAMAAFAWRSDGAGLSGADACRAPLPVENVTASAARDQHSLAALRALIDPADVGIRGARVPSR